MGTNLSGQHTFQSGNGQGKALGLLTWGVAIAAAALVGWIWMRSDGGGRPTETKGTNLLVRQAKNVPQREVHKAALEMPKFRSASTVKIAAREVVPNGQVLSDGEQFRLTNFGKVMRPENLPKALVQPTNSPRMATTTNGGQAAPLTSQETGTNAAVLERNLRLQVALVAQGISPGSVDGVMGLQTRAALKIFQAKEKLPATGQVDDTTWEHLKADGAYLSDYVVTEDDVERLQPLGKTWLEKSFQTRLEYETVLELVAEKRQASPMLLRRINQEVKWESITAGTKVKVPATAFPEPAGKAAFARIYLVERVLEVFDENTNLLAHFPCSIGQKAEKRPVGELHVAVLALNPNYTFDPEVFPESDEGRELGRKLILQPGPNNPVGTVWIGLDKPGYGIHGTPKPEQVGRTESHGCFRLANWNAEYFAKLAWVGMPVLVEK